MDDRTMGQRIAEERKKLGISQEALGDKMGVSRQAISKWEADAAMPEIDKLIGLSKLYHVSVGWLLGVEERSCPAEEKEEVSEALLRKIEEIVLRYRPKKQQFSARNKVLLGLLAAAVLWGSISFAGRWGRLTLDVATTGNQVRTNNEQNAMIMDQLAVLEAQLEEQKDTLLSDYRFEIFPLYSIADKQTNGAEVTFTAVPTRWQDGDVGILAIRHSTLGTVQEECDWDGAFLTASVALEEAYRYELCFSIRHADGTQEQQLLQDTDVESLRSTLRIPIHISPGDGVVKLEGTDLKLMLRDYAVYVGRPGIAQPGDTWDTLEYVLYLHRGGEQQVIGTYDLLGPLGEDDDIRRSATLEAFADAPVFVLPGAQEGDGLVLWLKVSMSNGMESSAIVDQWRFAEGSFENIETVFE